MNKDKNNKRGIETEKTYDSTEKSIDNQLQTDYKNSGKSESYDTLTDNPSAESTESNTPQPIKKSKRKKRKLNEPISFRQEVLRKLIHLLSLSIPVSYIFVTKEIALIILIPCMLICVGIDLFSKKDGIFRKIYKKIFGKMLRPHEKKKKVLALNGASWVFISAVAGIFIFPKFIAVTAFTILIVSDIAAALIGRKFGRNPLFDKSVEGTVAFIVSAMMVIVIYGFIFSAPWTYFAAGAAAAFIGGIAEAASKKLKVDDNFSIPFSVGLVLWLGEYIFYSIAAISYLNML